MKADKKRESKYLICSPRAVNFSHGTGVQISYLTQTFPAQFSALNFGHFEFGVGDSAYHLENPVVGLWPFKLKGRRSWIRLCESISVSYWRGETLQRHGRRKLNQCIDSDGITAYVGIVHDEASARRFQAIQNCNSLGYALVLYDYTDQGESGLAYTRLIANAQCVFAISRPLEELAKRLDAKRIERIGFFRPAPTVIDRQAERCLPQIGTNTPHVDVLVLAYAAPRPLSELIAVLCKVAMEVADFSATVHLVGNHPDYESPACCKVELKRYGVVSSEERDRIARMCNFAYLAGPCEPMELCPFSRYSLPSKLGDFLAVGLPTLARVATGSAAELTIAAELKPFVHPATDMSQVYQFVVEQLTSPAYQYESRSQAIEYAQQLVLLPKAGEAFIRKLADSLG